MTALDRGPATAERDPPARRRSPRSPSPARVGHVPGQGARASQRGSARRDGTEMSMVKSLERLEQRLAVMVAAQETSQAWSSLGEEGPVCFLFLFFQPSFAERQRVTCWSLGVAARGCWGPAGSGAGRRAGKETGGKWREVPERGESRRGARHRKRAGEGEPALLNEHLPKWAPFLTKLPTLQLFSSQD